MNPNAFKPTEEQRRMVKTMSGLGATSVDIARVLNISRNLVERRFVKELALGVVEANMKVAQSLFGMATHRPAQYDEHGNCVISEREPIPAAAMFWAKTRLKWTYPKQEVEVTATIHDELAELSDEQLIERYHKINAEIAALAARASRSGSDDPDAESSEQAGGLPAVH